MEGQYRKMNQDLKENEIFQKAAEQALRQAESIGEWALFVMLVGVILITIGCYLYYLGKQNRPSEDNVEISIILWGVGILIILAGLDGSSQAWQAKNRPELYVVKKIFRPADRPHIMPYPILLPR